MLIEQPPYLFRMLYPEAIWRLPSANKKRVYLTFDDGPIPEVTPWVLNLLDRYGIKATFFCVGDNVRKYPEVYEEVLRRGHRVGNHTMHHIQAPGYSLKTYLENVDLAGNYIKSSLFRPPHGWMKVSQFQMVKRHYRVVMWDVVTRDYSKRLKPQEVLHIVQKYTRNGSVIVFHDSLKSVHNLQAMLEQALQWLLAEGYVFSVFE